MAFFAQAIVILSSRIVPASPDFFISIALMTLILESKSSNQQPGFGCKALIFNMIVFALSFQLILDSFFCIFLA